MLHPVPRRSAIERHPLLIVLVCGLTQAGCLPRACQPGDSPTLALGTGVEDFVPLADPPTLDLVYGPQGGVHVDIALRATELDSSALWTIDLRGLVDGVVRGDARPQVEARCTPDVDALDVTGLRLVWHDDVTPADLAGPVDVLVEVRDAAGREITASAQGVSIVFP